MIRADGYRILRIIMKKPGVSLDAAPDLMRKRAVRKGLVLAMDGRNPAMPFRWRETGRGVYELEQLQIGSGTHALCPPEQPDMLERFLGGEAWVGVVKTATI